MTTYMDAVRSQVMDRIKTYSPAVQEIYCEGAEKVLSLLENIEIELRVTAWREGWAAAVKFGTDLYFGEGDAKSFYADADKLLRMIEDNPEALYGLMPSLTQVQASRKESPTTGQSSLTQVRQDKKKAEKG